MDNSSLRSAPPKAEKQKRGAAHRVRQAESMRRHWEEMTDEERKARAKHLRKTFLPLGYVRLTKDSVSVISVDDDFDEMGF